MTPLAGRIKPFIKNSRSWRVLKHLLPKYRRPLVRLGIARAKAFLSPKPANAVGLASAYAELAKIRLYEEALPQAITECDAAIAHDARCTAAYIHRGDALMRQGRSQEALEGLSRALLALPAKADQADIHIALANTLLTQRDALGAVRHYELACRLQPGTQWLSGKELVSGDDFQIGKKLMTYYPFQATAEKTLALLNCAADRFEAALHQGYAPDTAEDLLFCFYLSGRYRGFSEALRRHFTLREQQPAFQEFKDLGPRIEFMPDYCARSVGAIGWLTTFVKKKILLGTKERLVLCAPPEQVVNPAFLAYYKPYVDVLETPQAIAEIEPRKSACALPLDIGMRFDGAPKYIITAMAEVANRWEEENRPPLLTLSEPDRARGEAALEKIGLRKTDWWVCLHVRTPTYKREGTSSADTLRNADIESYYRAIKMITDRGGHVFRMGDPSMIPLPKMERVIDYANSELRSDWMDVFLCSQCRFYIGTNSGLLLVPQAFGVPSVATNNLPLLVAPFLPRDIFLPKLLRTKEGRLSTFQEMLQEPYVFAVTQGVYDGSGVEILSNSDEELRGAITEMLDSFDAAGERHIKPLTDAQLKFNRLVEEAGVTISGQISADFINRHLDLLK